MKSSAQRQIRAKVLEQIPFLAHPAAAPTPSAAVASTAAAGDVPPAADSDHDEDDHHARRKKGAGKDKKKGGKGKGANKRRGGGGGGGDDDDDEPSTSLPAQPPVAPLADEPDADEALTVLDLIWPKKETLSLVKWCANLRPVRPDRPAGLGRTLS